MTATFGKLEHQTLTLQPGLNVIHAPNEWGKSTWCAFLIAMLYGIDTRERTTQTSLADKEHYAPWSGSPMSGRMELLWNGRNITIERRTKGRLVFGDFRAYETDTGLDIPELTAANCGKLLLGVEKSVFTRAGFIRNNDLPVTEDESLRRRLNALVTTGDESGASDDLAQKLKDLKNRCRHNKTGLLPQAEAQRDGICAKLEQLQALQTQLQRIAQRQEEAAAQQKQLENHRDALAYEEAQKAFRQVELAQEACRKAEQFYETLKEKCDQLPSKQAAEESILQLGELQIQQEALLAEQLPTPPQKPEAPVYFPAMTPEQALQQARSDKSAFEMLQKPISPVFLICAFACIAAALALVFVNWLYALPFPVFAAAFLYLHIRNQKLQKKDREAVSGRYPELAPEQWIPAAQGYADAVAAYNRQAESYRAQAEDLQLRKAALEQNVEQCTFGATISECIDGWRETMACHTSLEAAYRQYQQAQQHAQQLAAMVKPVAQPTVADTLTLDAGQTQLQLTQLTALQHQLHTQHGQCLGQIEALGQAEALQRQLDQVNARIRKLTDMYEAILLAQQTLAEAANDLQRKFAPRISQRAQTLFSKFTGAHYDRFVLGEDLTVSAGRQEESTLRTGIWRSSGTVDQLYMALRLAVAEELTPAAPLVLDDALVRFDDTRLSLAMDVLTEAAQRKQVILFTCQSREAEACKEQA